MTDLQNIIMMLAKSDDDFSKRKNTSGTTISLTNRLIDIEFDKDGNFRFMSNEKR